jgi:hypothetical protein
MATDPTKLIEELGTSYKKIIPLLSYLKARLKYDTVRWIRTYGTKDDIVFSTRIKTFERVYDKLIRKAVLLNAHSEILDIALSGKGILDDLIGMRFICFDAFQIYSLVRYFLITERVTTSARTFYVSSKTDTTHPICRFLQSNGFEPIRKEGREYEDINFVIRFSHPIDKYFGSGLENFSSLAQRAESAPVNEKLSAVNELFDILRNDQPKLIRAISQIPIECQIVTASQHIYNRTQRPHYEYILQAKDGDDQISTKEVSDLSERLDVLKLNLLAADMSVYSVHKKFGIRYEPPSRINPGNLFKLEGRLPKDILGENSRIEEINTSLLATVIGPSSMTLKRKTALRQLFKHIAVINKKISERAAKEGDIADADLLRIGDLKEITHPEMVFWCFQRVIILILCVMLLYAEDEVVLSDIANALQFGKGREAHKLGDVDIIIGRLFENLEHIDNAIQSKLSGKPEKIPGWRDGYFSNNVFSDPLIQWRYASYMYSKREYENALQEIKVGIAIHNQLVKWERQGVKVTFPVPEEGLFIRRGVEYELCAEIAKLRFSPLTVAGVLELCNCVLARSEEWTAKLEDVARRSSELSERARCVCFQILFRLCALSAGGMKGPVLGTLRDEFKSKFEDIEREISSSVQNELKDRTWWLLANSVMDDKGTEERLKIFKERIDYVVHHPLERKQFEKACATLISLWKPAGATVDDRNEFAINMLKLLSRQTASIAQSESIAFEQTKALNGLLGEVLRELREKGKVVSHEGIRKKIGRMAGDALEHIIIDTAVAGLRGILGI